MNININSLFYSGNNDKIIFKYDDKYMRNKKYLAKNYKEIYIEEQEDNNIKLFYENKYLGKYSIKDLVIAGDESECSEEAKKFIYNLESTNVFFNDFFIDDICTKENALEKLYKEKEFTKQLDSIQLFSPFMRFNLEEKLSLIDEEINYINKKSKYLIKMLPEIHYRSRFSMHPSQNKWLPAKYHINKWTWAVTILKTQEPSWRIARENIPPSWITEHATILIEGIDSEDELFTKKEKTNKKGDYLLGKDGEFLYQGHLLENGVTDKLHPLNKTIIYTSATETKYYSADKVKSLIRKIQKDKKDNIIKWAGQGKYSAFNYFISLFSKRNEINCMDYVHDSLEILDWKLGDKSFKLFANTPSSYIFGGTDIAYTTLRLN